MKLAQEHWIGPWKVAAIEDQGLSHQSKLSGRRMREWMVSTVISRFFHPQQKPLSHAFDNEFDFLA